MNTLPFTEIIPDWFAEIEARETIGELVALATMQQPAEPQLTGWMQELDEMAKDWQDQITELRGG